MPACSPLSCSPFLPSGGNERHRAPAALPNGWSPRSECSDLSQEPPPCRSPAASCPSFLLRRASPRETLPSDAPRTLAPCLEYRGQLRQISEPLGRLLKAWVGNESYRVVDALGFTVLIDRWHCESGVGPNLYLRFGPSLPELAHQAL